MFLTNPPLCDNTTDMLPHYKASFVAEPEGPGICSLFLTAVSFLLFLATLPLSLCMCVKVVQEYERAVIFRLGRLLPGGAKGPGIFFVLPCIESYQKVDLRTITLGVPPQEVSLVSVESNVSLYGSLGVRPGSAH